MNSLVERVRSTHENVEMCEKGCVDVLIEEAKSHKETVAQHHHVNAFIDKIIERTTELSESYKDVDGHLANELGEIQGSGTDLFKKFYAKLGEVKDYHKRFPGLAIEYTEAESMLEDMGNEPPVQFTGDECHGKAIDVHEFHEKYLNLPGVEDKIDYVTYLDTFYRFSYRQVDRVTKEYTKYMNEVADYLVDFFRRSQPLFDIDKPLAEFEVSFEKKYSQDDFKPIGYNATKETVHPELYCIYQRRNYTNPNVFRNRMKGKKFKRAKARYEEVQKEVNRLEYKVNRLSDLLKEEIKEAKDFIQRKQSMTPEERMRELEDRETGHDLDMTEVEPEEEIIMTKENYPIGWDGQPIPYWLYKLHGLGNEYKCEICGNTSYWGRRAFERHFQEWRHAHGMKCLGVENTKDFHEITKIKDAIELGKKLRETRGTEAWVPEQMEECEDSEGNVMSRKMYEYMKKQGLVQ
mmetsp:Transcript_5720/g.6209  ORF Transcript_5720/g.6209 Transcript_5720/m.6209 type:complete len:463 (+) Transcript_5720:53-1441(+)